MGAGKEFEQKRSHSHFSFLLLCRRPGENHPSLLTLVAALPLHLSLMEGHKKSSPPFGKGRTGGIFGSNFQVAKLIPIFQFRKGIQKRNEECVTSDRLRAVLGLALHALLPNVGRNAGSHPTACRVAYPLYLYLHPDRANEFLRHFR
jgi:hypothetical protein